jgi:hypothetical protein
MNFYRDSLPHNSTVLCRQMLYEWPEEAISRGIIHSSNPKSQVPSPNVLNPPHTISTSRLRYNLAIFPAHSSQKVQGPEGL